MSTRFEVNRNKKSDYMCMLFRMIFGNIDVKNLKKKKGISIFVRTLNELDILFCKV